MITADAMSCQKEITKKIVEKKADYVIGLKDNQPNLRRNASEYYEDALADPRNYPEIQKCETTEKGHGRIEHRKYYLTTNLDWLSGKEEWGNLFGFGMVRSKIETNGVISKETRYYITSLKEVGTFANAVRSHWTVARQKEAAAFAKAHGMSGFRVDEVEMNLAWINRSNETCISKWLDDEFIAHHKVSGMAVGAYSPVASGVLAKLAEDGNTERWSAGQKSWYDLPYNHEVAHRLKKLSEETGYTMIQLQLAYVLSQPHGFSNFAISGSATLDQLVENMEALQIEMTPDMIDFLHLKER